MTRVPISVGMLVRMRVAAATASVGEKRLCGRSECKAGVVDRSTAQASQAIHRSTHMAGSSRAGDSADRSSLPNHAAAEQQLKARAACSESCVDGRQTSMETSL